LPLLSAAALMLPFGVGKAEAYSNYREAPWRYVPPRKPRAPRLLMIDPGHGGKDPGAIGRTFGTHEKDVVLDIGRRMADNLTRIRGVDVRMTRDRDFFLPLEERVRIAQQARADFFVSVHADSAPNPEARGLSVYTLSAKASDKLAGAIADTENRADMFGGVHLPPVDPDVAAILSDLATRRTHNTSLRVKADFVEDMSHSWPLLVRPMRAANFVVLRSPEVPSMLVETGFLSNPHDESTLRQPQARAQIARLMADNLARILDSSLFG
ncbi:MAG TPA: N-acetylmuramoyl-L-alanine amidase, partial [Alphaproteobacteria bacterium]|nr:N-acetylmuramoyl-L-alanine amidase [Alphaproteobacteria bacterium]